jgi:hypothetical protein
MLTAQRFPKAASWLSAWPGARNPGDRRGRPLEALRASCLLERFYCWRGVSGERYICSVFGMEEEGVVAGFSQFVAIGVAHEAMNRRPMCVLSARDFASAEGRQIRVEVQKLGVTEWHVHFGAGESEASDLAASLLN